MTGELAAYAGQDAPATKTSLSNLALHSLSVLPMPPLTAQNTYLTHLSDLRPSLTHRDFSLSYNRFNHAAPALLLMLSILSRLLEARLSFGLCRACSSHIRVRAISLHDLSSHFYLSLSLSSSPLPQSSYNGPIESGQAATGRRAKIPQLPSSTHWTHSGWHAKIEPIFFHNHQRS